MGDVTELDVETSAIDETTMRTSPGRGGLRNNHAHARGSVGRRAHNRKVGGSPIAPATKWGAFSRLLAYAQAADQHVWSAASVFVGTVCGDLLDPLRMQHVQGGADAGGP